MPLTEKGEEIMRAMKREYGAENGKRVFYASANAGKITGVHDKREDAMPNTNEFGSAKSHLAMHADACAPHLARLRSLHDDCARG